MLSSRFQQYLCSYAIMFLTENTACDARERFSLATSVQYVQNFAACIVCIVRNNEHLFPKLENLRELPVKTNLYYPDVVLAFKNMPGWVAEYLTSQFITRAQVSGRVTQVCRKLN